MSKNPFDFGQKDIEEVDCRFYPEKKAFWVDWGGSVGFGQSHFYMEGEDMYCSSEYMSKEFEFKVLASVYDKYGKPEWARWTFIHGHRYISDMGPPIVSVFEKFGDG